MILNPLFKGAYYPDTSHLDISRITQHHKKFISMPEISLDKCNFKVAREEYRVSNATMKQIHKQDRETFQCPNVQ